MEYFITLVRFAVDDLLHNKMRSFLTALGILIGIASVVLLTAFGLGLKKYIEDEFNSLGSNLIMIMPGKFLSGGNMSQSSMMLSVKFDDKDVNNLKKIENASLVAAAYGKYVTLSAEGNSETYELIASTAEMFEILNFEIDVGKLFDKADENKTNKIIVLGAKPAEKIFGGKENAVGKTVKVDDQSFRVIGVLKKKGGGGFGEPGMDDHILIPIKSALSFNPSKKYLGIYIKAENDSFVTPIKEEAKKILLKRYQEDDFSILDQKQILDMVASIFSILNLVLVGIAAISLIVGGIGVMNIMYVSVAERIQEIGIRRAVGATDHDILLQFLSEAIILSLLGGMLGLGISYLVVVLIQQIFPAYINIQSIVLALGVSSVIGIIFGVFPAKRASDLSPIEAIKHE